MIPYHADQRVETLGISWQQQKKHIEWLPGAAGLVTSHRTSKRERRTLEVALRKYPLQHTSIDVVNEGF